MNASDNTLRVAIACVLVSSMLGKSGVAAEQEEQTLGKIAVEDTLPLEATEGSNSYTTGAAATATGLALSLRETPQSVTVITRERMDDQAMTTVSDALRNTIGVSVKPVDRGRNNLSVRGFDVNNFQIDGVPTVTGNIGLETLNNSIYDRIEVVRGATGLLSGAGDPSAAVNLVRKHADSDKFKTAFTAEVGSWDQRTGTVDLSTPLSSSGAVRARVIASYSSQDAFVDLENTKNTVFYGIIDADLSESTRLSVGAHYQKDKRRGVLWAGLPYWYSDGTRTDFARSTTSATSWNRWDTTVKSAFASLEHEFSNGWQVRGDVAHYRQEEDSMLLWLWGDPDPATGGGMDSWPYHYFADPKQTYADVVLTGPFSLFGREHEVTVGVIRSKQSDGWMNADPTSAIAPVGDFNTWDGSAPEPSMTPLYVGSHGTTTQSAAYVAVKLQATDRFKFIAGGRVSDWEREEEEGAWTSEAYSFDHSGIFTPYAGLVFDLTEQVSAYASYTDSFKPQTSQDRNGNYLDPLVGNSYEVGLKSELVEGRVNASAAFFRTEQDNYAIPDVGFFVPGTANPASRTAEGVKVQGYELEVTGELTEQWSLSLGWTKFSAKDAEDVDVAVDHSRKQLKFFSKYKMQGAWEGLAFGGGVNWEGDRPASAFNPATGDEERVGQPAYSVIDLMTGYDFSEALSLQLNVSNAFDKKYRSGSYWWGAPYTYGEPRKVLLTMDYYF